MNVGIICIPLLCIPLLCRKELNFFRIIVFDSFCKNPHTGRGHLKRGRKRWVKGRANESHRVELDSVQFRWLCMTEIKFELFSPTFNLGRIIFSSESSDFSCLNFTSLLHSITFSPCTHCLPTSREFNTISNQNYISLY